MLIHVLAEGTMEEWVAKRLLALCGHSLGVVYGKQGCDYIRAKAALFRHRATETSGVLVLTDFRDAGAECIPEALQAYLRAVASLPKSFLCRFAVQEVESWLLADRENLAKFLGVSVEKLPLAPESEQRPKRTLVNIANSSKKTRIRKGLALPPGERGSTGPEYTALMCEFVMDSWNVEAAMNRSPSLERCVRRLRELRVK